MSKSNQNSKGAPSQRQLRMGELVRKELSDVFVRGEVYDSALDGVIVTVPEVRLTPDLRLATVLVMPMGGRNAESVVEALNNSKKYLRGQISKRITAKYMPELRFVLDTRFDDDDKIGTLLHQPDVSRDLQNTEN